MVFCLLLILSFIKSPITTLQPITVQLHYTALCTDSQSQFKWRFDRGLPSRRVTVPLLVNILYKNFISLCVENIKLWRRTKNFTVLNFFHSFPNRFWFFHVVILVYLFLLISKKVITRKKTWWFLVIQTWKLSFKIWSCDMFIIFKMDPSQSL